MHTIVSGGAATRSHHARFERIPRATYRLQFNPQCTFADAAALVAYLDELGISDLYASPLLAPRLGSTHGYDIVDHSRINPALGGETGLTALSTALRERGMGLLLDIVPNHMGIGAENAWWMDVLENGPGSIYADYFDIDWNPARPELGEKVLLPILGDQYGDVLERGELRLAFEDGTFFVFYYDLRLPIAPRTYQLMLEPTLENLKSSLDEGHPHLQELYSILTALRYLPPRTRLPTEKLVERNREKQIIKRRLDTLVRESEAVRAAIDAQRVRFNGTVGDPTSFDLLDTLLDAQPYRPAFWRVAAEEINYRRFFDINELAAIRVEVPDVFEATHAVVFRLLAEGVVTGLRIDHPDGLLDPAAYFTQLQARYRDLAGRNHQLYVVAEKILSEGETLREDWAIAGTTGYDFLNIINGMFVVQASALAFDEIYGQFVGGGAAYHQLVNANKKMIMLVSLASEIGELSHQLERLAERNRRYRDFTLGSLTFALREVLACLPIYRTYLTGPDTATAHDQAAIGAAVAEAKRHNPRTATAVFDFIHDTLLLHNLERFRSDEMEQLTAFVCKFQQLSGPVMAKGVEDTSFYVYNRLVSLNEVGGHPHQFGVSVEAFHAHNAAMQRRWPHTMLTTSTHDTKRSEDVRSRLNVLSEFPEAWQAALTAWQAQHEQHRTTIESTAAPDRNDIYLLYQTILGTWPLDRLGDDALAGSDDNSWWRQAYIGRVGDYMQKATKEAKQRTSWINPNVAYDQAMRRFVEATLREPLPAEVATLLRQVAYFGQFNALAQLLLKLTAPGVPDIYQGNELWDFSLVDPDNRRPVDWAQRRTLLANIRTQLTEADSDRRQFTAELLKTSSDGRIKLFLTERVLTFRREHTALFAHGSYQPLLARGAKAAHVCAFARDYRREQTLVVAPRLFATLTGGELRPPIGKDGWQNTWLALPQANAGDAYRNELTGEIVRVAQYTEATGLPLQAICASFPIALLMACRK